MRLRLRHGLHFLGQSSVKLGNMTTAYGGRGSGRQAGSQAVAVAKAGRKQSAAPEPLTAQHQRQPRVCSHVQLVENLRVCLSGCLSDCVSVCLSVCARLSVCVCGKLLRLLAALNTAVVEVF